jgi:hypothetical protein
MTSSILNSHSTVKMPQRQKRLRQCRTGEWQTVDRPQYILVIAPPTAAVALGDRDHPALRGPTAPPSTRLLLWQPPCDTATDPSPHQFDEALQDRYLNGHSNQQCLSCRQADTGFATQSHTKTPVGVADVRQRAERSAAANIQVRGLVRYAGGLHERRGGIGVILANWRRW